MSEFRRKLMMAYAANLGRGDIIYPGLIAAWSAKGKSNDDADRAVLRDLTGNGHDITLNNFAYSDMSGYGGILSFTNNPLNCEKLASGKYRLFRTAENIYFSNLYRRSIHSTFKVKITGVESSGTVLYYSNNGGSITLATIEKDGIYTIPAITEISGWAGFVNNESFKDIDIVIEILPEYPDALVFDGIDDYHTPIKYSDLGFHENYTVIGVITPLGESLTNRGAFVLSTNAAVTNVDFSRRFECRNINSGGKRILCYVDTFPASKKISYTDNDVYMSANNKGDNDIVFNIVGVNYLSSIDYLAKIAFYSAYIFNRALDEQEIKAFIRKYIDPEYLLPSEIPNPDCYYDFSLGSNDDENRETIVDQSGNGNDATAHNFAWSGMSGYGGYNLNLKTLWGNDGSYTEKTSTETKIDFVSTSTTSVTAFRLYKNYNIPFGKTIRFKVSGIVNGKFSVTFSGFVNEDIANGITYYSDDFSIDIPALEKFNPNDNNAYIGVGFTTNGDTNVALELVPEYEGALVLDGVDDYIRLNSFISGFKTMFMLCQPFKLETILYDQRSVGNDYALFNSKSLIAYKARNENDTYINGKLNSKILTEELLNKKHLISVYTQNVKNAQIITLGASKSYSNNANMALYKFLGFKEALTEEQIKAIIKKYNLLDGVDNIEVS